MSTIPAFGPWTEDTHKSESQGKSLKAARLSETTPLQIDREAQTGVFFGRGKEPYTASLSSCTCNSFTRRRLPCKHIYRLAMELGIIDQPYKTGASKGERLSLQLSLEDAVSIIESLTPEAQLVIMEMLVQTNDQLDTRRNPCLIEKAGVIDELRSCPLLEEHPATQMMLSRMKRDALNEIIVLSGVENPPRKSSPKALLADWALLNIPNLPDMLPPCAAFAFIEGFDKSQRNTYQYLLRKYTDDTVFLSDGNIVCVPHGSRQPDLSLFILVEGSHAPQGANRNAFYFPDDSVTALLTKYGCNRCLNGFIPE